MVSPASIGFRAWNRQHLPVDVLSRCLCISLLASLVWVSHQQNFNFHSACASLSSHLQSSAALFRLGVALCGKYSASCCDVTGATTVDFHLFRLIRICGPQLAQAWLKPSFPRRHAKTRSTGSLMLSVGRSTSLCGLFYGSQTFLNSKKSPGIPIF